MSSFVIQGHEWRLLLICTTLQLLHGKLHYYVCFPSSKVILKVFLIQSRKTTKLFSSLSFAALLTNVPINHSSIFNFQQTVYKHCEKKGYSLCCKWNDINTKINFYRKLFYGVTVRYFDLWSDNTECFRPWTTYQARVWI